MGKSEENYKKTPLYEKHLELGATMVPFAGWYMPVKYKSVVKEHMKVRKEAGIFDISHMGEFVLEGKDVIPFIQKMVTNDLRLLENGKSQYACMCYPNGTVVDDLIYYQVNPTKFRMIVNASNIQKDLDWLKEHVGNMDVNIEDHSKDRCRFAYQGPKSEDLIQPIVNVELEGIKRFYFRNCHVTVKGKDGEEEKAKIFLTRTGYTGEKGFEISGAKKNAVQIFKALLKTGAKPIGLGARD